MKHRVTAVVGLLALAGGAWGAGQQFVVTELAVSGVRHYAGGGLTLDDSGRIWSVIGVPLPQGEEEFRLYSFAPGEGVVYSPVTLTDFFPVQLHVSGNGQVVFDTFQLGDEVGRRGYRAGPGLDTWTALTTGVGSAVSDVNNSGDVSGWIGVGSDFQAAVFRADGTIVELGTLGATWGSANAINDAGLIVGMSGNGQFVDNIGVNRAFMTTGEALIDLGTLGGTSASANDVNELGQIVGSTGDVYGNSEAFIYTVDAGMASLGTFAGQENGEAGAINDLGWVIGHANTSDDGIPFLWSAQSGLVDLRGLLDFGDDVEVLALLEINNSGHIAALVDVDGVVQTARITVALVPAPSGAALAGLALFVGARRRRI